MRFVTGTAGQSFTRSQSLLGECWPVRVLNRIRSFLVRLLSCACFSFSNICGPLVFVMQMGFLDWIIYGYAPLLSLVVFGLEGILVVHMVLRSWPAQVVRSGSFQWTVYSWLIALKAGILYFQVVPNEHGSIRMYVSWMCLTPVFYCIVTFRTLGHVFDGSEGEGGLRRKASAARNWQRGWGRNGTLDVLLLQDMVWHVVVDMVDMMNMMFLADLNDEYSQDGIAQSLIQRFPVEIHGIVVAAGVFVILGFFFHSQSFPRVNLVGTTDIADIDGHNQASRNAVVAEQIPHGAVSAHESEKKAGKGLSGPMNHTYTVDVVRARKRSAVVSILLVDLPFFILRSYIYSLSISYEPVGDPSKSVSTVEGAVGSSTEGGTKPQLDKWWVKNFICLLLQAMQLRLVQRADLEQSQNLKWMDVCKSEASASRRLAKRRRNVQDPRLRAAWELKDMAGRSKLAAAMCDLGAFTSEEEEMLLDSHESDGTTITVEIRNDGSMGSGARFQNRGLEAGNGPNDGELSPVAESHATTSRSERNLAKSRFTLPRCCCSRCPCARRRSCVRDCSGGIFMHSIMGLVLGWFVAKTDFNQVIQELIISLGPHGRG
eukprot:TRINITY_DN1720_c0_g1_i1.p1 TRINITY_DN1720_c0_g1~~TRINITY_DN1720_c0_g1_i1.p1  ORF type:complete len:600 (-),score=55.95 TRINITY_DN1720_c0_g1_i1:55-1854(-)